MHHRRLLKGVTLYILVQCLEYKTVLIHTVNADKWIFLIPFTGYMYGASVWPPVRFFCLVFRSQAATSMTSYDIYHNDKQRQMRSLRENDFQAYWALMSLDFLLDPFLCSGPFTRDVIQLRIKRQFYTQIETVNWICVVTFASICAAWRKSARVCHSFHLHGLAAEIHGTGHVTWGGRAGFCTHHTECLCSVWLQCVHIQCCQVIMQLLMKGLKVQPILTGTALMSWIF